MNKFIIVLLILISACNSKEIKKVSKNDTAQTWLHYFNHVGNPATRDTSTFAIRIIVDTFTISKTDTLTDGSIKFTKDWIHDTIYFVPYDSILYKGTDTAKHVTVFVPLPKGWQLYDYNKLMQMSVK